MRGLGGESEKNKNKRCLCLERRLGSAPDTGTVWKQAAMMLGGATETSSYVSERSEGVPGSLRECFCGMLRAAKLAPANENQQPGSGKLGRKGREGHALGAPGMGFKKKGERGPPNPAVRNRSP